MAQITVHRTGQPTRAAFPVSAVRGGTWGGWSDLFDEFLRDRQGVFGPELGRSVRSRGVYPPVNLHETADAYVLTAELPGVAAEDIDVSMEGNTVTVSGQRKIEFAAGDGTAVHRRERQSGHFRRAFELPSQIDVGAVEAKHRMGVLELRLPKTPESKPRQIAIQTS
jgi:HSP20 family protein